MKLKVKLYNNIDHYSPYRLKPWHVFAGMLLVAAIVYMTFNLPIKQDDGWYLSYIFKWLQKLDYTNVKSYWDFTDTNDYDFGCGFTFTILEGLFFIVSGINVATMKLLNTIEACVLCWIVYKYIARENRLPGLITVTCLIGWSMFNTDLHNRPELPASIVAMVILYKLSYKAYNKRSMFLCGVLLNILLDMHPLSLFLVFGMCVKVFVKNKDARLYLVGGGITGLMIYFTGNYLVNDTFGIFTGTIRGIKMTLGDHYVPLFDTGWGDIVSIFNQRFTFITKVVGVSGYVKVAGYITTLLVSIYLLATKTLWKNTLLTNSLITYVGFILLSTLFSEAIANGFMMYHAIAFILFYSAVLYSIYSSMRMKGFAIVGLLPFVIYAKDSVIKARSNQAYHISNGYYRDFIIFNDALPATGKVLMRPTHAPFSYLKEIHFDYTYGLLRYMHKEHLSFKDAIIRKGYNYIVTDKLFEREFFLDKRSDFKDSPSPYYVPLRNTGITSAEFEALVSSGFLTTEASLYDIFAGATVLYKVNPDR